jgi:hypothetical protein
MHALFWIGTHDPRVRALDRAATVIADVDYIASNCRMTDEFVK